MFLNFHTHSTEKQANQQSIYNLIIPEKEDELENFSIEENGLFSVGIHPWHINEIDSKIQLKKLAQLVDNQSVKLIGECGLDRLRGVSLHLQEEVFIKQIRLAEDVRKPILIHCVKCFNELISIKKIVRPKIPMVIHGFNNQLEIAKQLLEKDFYFSLGMAILNENSNARKVLEIIPTEKIFLETDDKNINIEEIYQKVSEVKELNINDLEEIIFENYLNICLN